MQRATSGKKLQVLDGVAELFWLSEPTQTRQALIGAEIEGATTIEAWQQAVTAIQQKYPLLRARIRKIPGERPYFESLPDESLTLQVVPYRNGISIDELIAEAFTHSFGLGEGLLARVILCHSSERTLLIFTTHHAAFDGKTNADVIFDLLAAASGESLGEPLPLPPTVCELLEMEPPAPYTKLLPGPLETKRPELDLSAPKVFTQRLSAEGLSRLLACARRENTTVQGALVAAFLLAGRRLSSKWQTQPVVCNSPIDLRPLLASEKSSGVVTSAHFTVLSPEDSPAFWDFARKIREEIRSTQNIQVSRTLLLRVRSMLAQEMDPYDLSTLKIGVNHQLKLSNYGKPLEKTDYGALRLTALYPNCVIGEPDTQAISVITVNGALCLCHVSREPFPSLLADSLALLQEVCDEPDETTQRAGAFAESVPG